MTERPILFTPGNVRAILDGHKTQTRRIVKPEPLCDVEWFGQLHTAGPDNGLWFPMKGNPKDCDERVQADGATVRCPYGVVGDRLYVREGLERSKNLIGVSYRSDGEPVGPIPTGGWYRWEWHRDTLSPIHMPKWAARLWLEIVEVRVERLREISEEDAIAEGIERAGGAASCNPWRNYRLGKPGEMDMHCSAPTRSYMTLWESINGGGSWEQNSWVWAITFRVVAR